MSPITEKGIVYTLALIGSFFLMEFYESFKEVLTNQKETHMMLLSTIEGVNTLSEVIADSTITPIEYRDNYLLVQLPPTFDGELIKIVTEVRE